MLVPLTAAGAAAVGLAGWSAYKARQAEELVPPDGAFVDVPGARLHYVDSGTPEAGGPTLLMIHGLMGQLRNFSHSLSERLTRDHRVVLVDRPGWGHSALDGPRPGVAGQAAMIAALIEGLELDRPVVVGHSLGGAVALALGLDRPDLVRGLALLAPLTRPTLAVPKPFVGLLAPGPMRPVMAWLAAVPLGTLNAERTAQAVFAPDPVPADFVTRGGGALALRPKSYMAGSFEIQHVAIEMAGIARRYGDLRVPTAILYGRQDRVLDPESQGSETAAAIPNASIEMIEGGHMLPVNHAAACEEWLRRRFPSVALSA